MDKLSYLAIQSDLGTLIYVRGPQGLPGISEYQEELTDVVLGDMVMKGDAVNSQTMNLFEVPRNMNLYQTLRRYARE